MVHVMQLSPEKFQRIREGAAGDGCMYKKVPYAILCFNKTDVKMDCIRGNDKCGTEFRENLRIGLREIVFFIAVHNSF